MATLAAATVLARTGLTVSGAFAAASTSDKFANTGKQYLLVNNAAVGSKVLTFASAATLDSLAVDNPTVTVLATSSQLIGPFKPSVFNDGDGYVTVTVPDATDVTYKVVQADTVVNQ